MVLLEPTSGRDIVRRNYATKIVSIATDECMKCGKSSQVEITVAEARRLEVGIPIQDVLSGTAPEDRELLRSGTHPGCWKRMFG
jgi:hypothetical protein